MKVLIDSVINHYEKYIHPNFPSKKVSYTDYEKEIDSVLGFYFLEFKEEGRSIENRPIHSIKFGTGKRKILIWTQMHGNEASATRALFDVFNALNDKQNKDLKDLLSNELQILFVPMLNPDGAERYQRRNAIDIDPNRDAAKKESPEIQTLFKIIENFQPDWCFNMHDQRNLFNVSGTNKPATISFLSPSTSSNEKLTKGQKEAMQLIDCVASDLSSTTDLGIARFSHEFYPTATGDNIQAMGYRSVLVESGGFRNDPNRLVARKVVFESVFKFFYFVATDKWEKGSKENYLKIPMNDIKLFDLLIKNVRLGPNSELRADIGIELSESLDNLNGGVRKQSVIKDIGDLSHYHGYIEIDGEGGCLANTIKLNQKAGFDIIFEKTEAKKSTIYIRNGYIQ